MVVYDFKKKIQPKTTDGFVDGCFGNYGRNIFYSYHAS
jgi:hypothetical protein